MKISPVLAAPTPTVNPNEGHSYSKERMARAQAIAQGGTPIDQAARGPAPDPQVEKAENSIRRLKMRTQRTVHRELPVEVPAETPEPVAAEVAPATAPVDTLDSNEQTQGAEATKPLSPQAAAIAKARRAAQIERQQVATERAAFEAEKAEFAKTRDNPSGAWTKDQLQANALGILREAGVTNEQLTEALLQEQSDYGPGYSKLEARVNAQDQLIERLNAGITERDAATETQVLTQIRKDVDTLIATGDEFETVREAGYAPKVVELIHKTFKKTGEVLDERAAATLLENQLIEDSVAQLTKLKKVQSRLAPPPAPAPATPGKQPGPNTKIMRTLTNRDGSSSISMNKRERAIAAMEGRLK